jgi:hypothetical protein
MCGGQPGTNFMHTPLRILLPVVVPMLLGETPHMTTRPPPYHLATRVEHVCTGALETSVFPQFVGECMRRLVARRLACVSKYLTFRDFLWLPFAPSFTHLVVRQNPPPT